MFWNISFPTNQKRSIVVSGSHGKTTTSTYITTLFSYANRNPTIIGGIVPLYNRNYNFSDSELLIAEADESDGSLVKFNPNIGVITNLEFEHVDHYRDLDDLIKTMKQFGEKCEYLITNFDCENLKKNIRGSHCFSLTISNINFA